MKNKVPKKVDKPKRIIPEAIEMDDKTIYFHQDPMVFMTVDFGPKGGNANGTVKGKRASDEV